MIYLQLFLEFFKVGLFAVGGGLATLPFLQDMGVRTGWFTSEQLTNMLAVSECTPGAIGVNMATYAGFQTAGFPGAVVATLGLVSPSIIVVFIVAGILKKFSDNKYVKALFYGLRPASTGLIGAACIGVAITILFSKGGGSIGTAINDIGSGAGLSAFLSCIEWRAVVLAVILWLLMNLGGMEKFKDNAVLKKLNTIHPIFFLAVSAVVGIALGFAG